METKDDFSYGIIPVRQTNGIWEVFLIHQFSNIGNNSYWVFPKGHAEGEETPLQSAERELLEETGMRASSILPEPTFSLEYSFTYEDVRINKQVVFFIGLIEAQTVTLRAKEVKEAGWYDLEAATTRLDYQDTKTMFTAVKKFLATYSVSSLLQK